jgi:MFS family permease
LFGANVVLFPTIIAEIFGGENFGKVFAFLQISSSTASLAIPVIVTSISGAAGKNRYLLPIIKIVKGGYDEIMFVVGASLVTSAIVIYKRKLEQYQELE